MNACHHCQVTPQRRDKISRPAGYWRRAGEVAGWVVPGATLILLPKCPVCVAMYVALISGVSMSVASASKLRTSLLIVCIAIVTCLAVWRLWRCAARSARVVGDPSRKDAVGTGERVRLRRCETRPRGSLLRWKSSHRLAPPHAANVRREARRTAAEAAALPKNSTASFRC
jgi:membrane protein implicated in regulation of membrane protease activity